uniref:DUF357 domain-containing protein n=1 Tax=Ignisphaera aggregans TaxID=334771 RepID=A0A7C2VL25_9CREN
MEVAPCERLARYITNFKNSIKNLKLLDSSASKIVSLAIDYLKDSQYYLDKGDCITGLVTISYAEGLLDALRMLNVIEMGWKKTPETLVLAGGSFDIIHPGHIEFLKWASSLGDKLIVVVSRDKNYRRFKGYDPVFNENDRLKIVESIRYVYRAIVGSETDLFKSIMSVKPSIVALGYDQLDQEYVQEELRNRGLEDIKVIKMNEKVGNYSSSSIKTKICRDWCGTYEKAKSA